jgi:hypothetical protein
MMRSLSNEHIKISGNERQREKERDNTSIFVSFYRGWNFKGLTQKASVIR